MSDDDTQACLPDGPVEPVAGGGVIRREAYRPTFRENIQTFLAGIALRFSRRQILIAGPYAGEFGHEIMDFQSFIRWFRSKYREVHVITFPGREPLYRGCTIHAHHFDLKTAGYYYGRITHREIVNYVRDFARGHSISDYDMFSTMHMRSKWHRRILFREVNEIIRPLAPVQSSGKILFHFRNVDKPGPDRSRNLRPELAARVCELCAKSGLRIASVGHPKYSLCPDGCEDRRTEDLEQTVAEMAACRLVVGELSGPLHLAVYCARPIVTWAPGRDRIAYALKRNPFQVTIVAVRDNVTNPPANEIVAGIQKALALPEKQ